MLRPPLCNISLAWFDSSAVINFQSLRLMKLGWDREPQHLGQCFFTRCNYHSNHPPVIILVWEIATGNASRCQGTSLRDYQKWSFRHHSKTSDQEVNGLGVLPLAHVLDTKAYVRKIDGTMLSSPCYSSKCPEKVLTGAIHNPFRSWFWHA